jgi:hypothetical protein
MILQSDLLIKLRTLWEKINVPNDKGAKTLVEKYGIKKKIPSKFFYLTMAKI